MNAFSRMLEHFFNHIVLVLTMVIKLTLIKGWIYRQISSGTPHPMCIDFELTCNYLYKFITFKIRALRCLSTLMVQIKFN